jgi:GNAT superfamily N-acetyltransferase
MSSYQILPLQLSDTLDNLLVSERAFHAHNNLLYKAPLSPSSREAIVKSRDEGWPGPGNVSSFKAVNEAGELVASSRWQIFEDDEDVTLSVEEAVNQRMKMDIPEMRKGLARDLYTVIIEGKREVLRVRSETDNANDDGGMEACKKLQKRIELVGLHVDPAYQRRGIASALLKWGLEESDRLGLPIYLEATEEGMPVYERYGFETVKAVEFDGRPYGADIVARFSVGIYFWFMWLWIWNLWGLG